MRKIFSQAITSSKNQLSLAKLSNSIGVAQSRVLEAILEAIETDVLAAVVTGKNTLKESNIVKLDCLAVEAIRNEISQCISSLADRAFHAAHDGARAGIVETCESINSGEQA